MRLRRTGGKGTFLLKVERNDDDCWYVDKSQTEARYDTERDAELTDTGREGTGQTSNKRDQASSDCRPSAAKPRSQRTGHGATDRRDRNEQGPDPRRPTFSLTENDQKFGEENAEGEAETVGDHVGRERGKHHRPAPAAVWGLRLSGVDHRRRRVGARRGPAMSAAAASWLFRRRLDLGVSRRHAGAARSRRVAEGRRPRQGVRVRIGLLGNRGHHPGPRIPPQRQNSTA